MGFDGEIGLIIPTLSMLPLLIWSTDTSVKQDNILDKFEFERSRAKVKVTVAIFRKRLSSL